MYINKPYRSYLKILIVILFFFPKNVYSSCNFYDALADFEHPEAGWCFNQSTIQFFYNFSEAFVTYDDGSRQDLIPGDAIGAFKRNDPDGVPDSGDEVDICLGWSYIVEDYDENGNIIGTAYQVYMNGTDSYIEGLDVGGIPSYFKIWINDDGKEYDSIIDNKEPILNEDVENDCYEEGMEFEDINGNGIWDASVIPAYQGFDTQHYLQKIKGFESEVDCNGDVIPEGLDCSDSSTAGCAFLDDCRMCIGGDTCLPASEASYYNEVEGFITESDFGGGYDCKKYCPDDDEYGYFIGNCGDCLSPDLDPDFWKDCNDDCHPNATPYGCTGDQDCGLKEFDSLYLEYSDTSNGCCHPDDMTTWYADNDLDLLGDPDNQYSLCLPELLDSIVTNSYDYHPDCNSNSVDDCGICDGFYLDQDGDGINDYVDCMGVCNPTYASDEIISEQELNGEVFGAMLDDCGICDVNPNNDNETCTGCTDPDAINYVPDATINDYECYFGVWPGDTDRNGLVDQFDIIPVGVFWGERGSPRTLTSGNDYTWQQQIGYDNWDNTPALYADANGDGVINIFDILVVFINYNSTTEYLNFTSSFSDYYANIDLSLYRAEFENIYMNLPNIHENSDIHYLLENLFGFDPVIEIPSQFKLHQNRPNPFNPTTKIVYEIPISSNVVITISNIAGEVIIENQLGLKEPGIYSFDFDGSNISSGVYFYQLESSNGTVIKNKMMLIK